MSGYLNVVPIQSGATYTVGPPSIDFGSDGDYALDLNTNTLYGPKDSSLSQPWPIGPRLGGSLIWLGAWTSWIPGTFTTGQVIDDGTGQYYICVKPHTVTINNTGPWTTGQYYVDSSVSPTYYYICFQDTSVSPLVDPTNWISGDAAGVLYADSVSASGVGGNWQALSSTITVDNTVGIGNRTNFIVKNQSIDTAQLADAAVSNAKLLKTSGSEAVSTGAIRSNAVTTAKIADLNVTTEKINDNAITTAKIASSQTITTPTIDAGATGTTTMKAGTQTAFTISNFASNTIPLVAFSSSTQLVGAAFNSAGMKLNGSGSGYTTITSANSSSTNYAITIPAVNGNVVTTGDSQTVTSSMISGTGSTSGYVLTSTGTGSAPTWQAQTGAGTTTNSLTFGTTGLKATTGTSPWNGSAAATIDIDNTKVPTISGGNTVALTTSGATSLTLPTSGTVAILGANTFTANQNMNSNKITSLGTPTATTDAATKTYVDKRDAVQLTATTASITSSTLTAINLTSNAASISSGNSALNTQIVTATPTSGASIANGFVQVNQACWVTVTGMIIWPVASVTGLRWVTVRQYSAGSGTNLIRMFYDGVHSPSTNQAQTAFGYGAGFANTVTFTTYAFQYDFFNLWGYHTQGAGVTPVYANLQLTINSFT